MLKPLLAGYAATLTGTASASCPTVRTRGCSGMAACAADPKKGGCKRGHNIYPDERSDDGAEHVYPEERSED